jgi:peptidyl-prolyl cis-trans isomerase SurA
MNSSRSRDRGAFAMAALLACAVPGVWAQSPRIQPTPGGLPFAVPPQPTSAAPTILNGRLVDRIVAVVNDEVITAQELSLRVRIAEQQLARQRIQLPPADVLRRQVLERMIIDRAQVQQAKETGVRVDDATVNAAILRMAEQSSVGVAQLRERLERDGVPFARFREDVRDDIMMARLRDREVDSKVQIAEGELDNFIAAQAGVQAGSIEYNIAHILLRVPDNASPDRIEETRRRAEDLMQQLRSGADFAKLAASYSAAPEALNGGDLGWRTAERLPAVFLDAVKDKQPGEIGQLVRSPGGFHILKLLGQRDAAQAKLATTALEQTRARHILLRVTDLTPEVDVRRRLTDLRDRVVKGGQDFGQLARLHSVDPSSTRGGDLGWLYPGDTVPEFERAMAQLKNGDVSEPVQSPFGWHLIQVIDRRKEESPAERNRLMARQSLRERKAEEAFQEWLRQLRDRTYVEYRLEES